LAAVIFFAVTIETADAQNTATPADVRRSMNAALERTVRADFMTYTLREEVERRQRTASQHYVPLDFTVQHIGDKTVMRAEFDVPPLWLDRAMFVRTEAMQTCARLVVNGREAGEITCRMQEEFDITPFFTDGPNRVEIRATGIYGADARPQAYVFSQPMVRIEDFLVTVVPQDSIHRGRHDTLVVKLMLRNGYNFPEPTNVGYDIYDPNNRLQNYDFRDMRIPGAITGGRDTIEFRELMYGGPTHLWSADHPALYTMTLIVRQRRRPTEYIPIRIGFGKTEFAAGRLIRNDRPVEINAARYAAAADRRTTADELARLKRAGINTILLSAPQPYWFYDLTDELGIYVFDSPSTGCDERCRREHARPERNANDPAVIGPYIYRARAMFARNRNRPSVVGWSLGEEHGNGYNLYQTYRWLREADPARPVIYNGAAGEWNSDMPPIQAVDAHEVLSRTPAPAPARAAQNARR